MATRPEDRYSNLATIINTETAANTLTFTELLTGISLGQGIGMLIDEIDYYPAAGSLEDLIDPADQLRMALTTSNAITDIEIDNRAVIHQMHLTIQGAVGTPASGGEMRALPFKHQFFPPLIVAAPRLYLGVAGVSLAAATIVRMRLYFRYLELTTKEYLELAESFILVG